MVMSWTASALFDMMTTNLTTLPKHFRVYINIELTNHYLDSSMAAQVKVKFSWMTDFGVDNGTCKLMSNCFISHMYVLKIMAKKFQIKQNEYQVIYSHFCQQLWGQNGCWQTTWYDVASEPQQKSREADSQAPKRHMPEFTENRNIYIKMRK